jgi:hypothetical protein
VVSARAASILLAERHDIRELCTWRWRDTGRTLTGLERCTTLIERDQIFVNGEWVDSPGDGVISFINPVTEEPIATIPAGVAEDVHRVAQALLLYKNNRSDIRSIVNIES